MFEHQFLTVRLEFIFFPQTNKNYSRLTMCCISLYCMALLNIEENLLSTYTLHGKLRWFN